ncbi:MAG: type I 3-dehydroquinate dehydratase [Eubacterium sp.]|nr:type I 3-dehydroquinate dehydratase [Eubacterium sp.]
MIIRGRKIGDGMPLLCVSVSDVTSRAIRKRIMYLADRELDAVEWRADNFNLGREQEATEKILSMGRHFLRDKIFIYTYRTVNEGGNGIATGQDYERIVLMAASSNSCDFVDCEINGISEPGSFIRQIKNYGCRVIASCHDFDGTPDSDEIMAVLTRMKDAGADICKVAYTPKNSNDVHRLMETVQRFKVLNPGVPVIGISMGELGVESRICGEFFGSCLTFAAVEDSDKRSSGGSAPGQVNYTQMGEALQAIHRAACCGKKLYFIGFMGTGKTSVTKKLCRFTGCDWVDVDRNIEVSTGKNITDIFDEVGEEGFRKLETGELQKIADMPGRLVVSCGGGVVTREENVRIMRESGEIILLTATPETVFSRVSGSLSRPILNGHMNIDYIRELMSLREEAYERAATAVVRTDDMGVEQIARHIKKLYF